MCSMHAQRVRKHGDPTWGSRTCGECGEGFRYTLGKGRRKPFCDSCVAKRAGVRTSTYNRRQQRARAGGDPELLARLREYNFRSNIRKYGITPSDFDAMLAQQRGLCAICGDAPDPEGRGAYARLHIDHDHTSGAVRALPVWPMQLGSRSLPRRPRSTQGRRRLSRIAHHGGKRVKVRMKTQVLGNLDGVRWPAPGGEVDLPERVALHEIRAGRAEVVAEKPRPEKRPAAKRAEKRG